MRTSFMLWFAGALLLGRSALGRPDDAQSTKPADPCATPMTWSDIENLPESVYEEKDATTSTGEGCCRLCYESELDCTAAAWDEESQKCRMALNTRAYPGAETTEQCPLGVSTIGDIDEVEDDWSAWILGPCYNPRW